MTRAFTVPLDDGRRAEIRFSTRADGDLSVRGHVSPDDLARRRRALSDAAWTWLDQVHGADVVVVERPGGHAGDAADAAVTAQPGAALAVHAADCAPVLFASPEGVVGAAHAGWRGLAGGVIDHVARQMRALGAATIAAYCGPVICPEHYEFGAADLDAVARTLGDAVRSTTERGTPALDLWSGVRQACATAGVELAAGPIGCTAEGDDFFSHRARGEAGRHAGVIWIAGD